MRLAGLLFDASEAYSSKFDGNISIYALAGIPMLMSALRCLLIELNGGALLSAKVMPKVRERLATDQNETAILCDLYPVPSALAERLHLLLQVRHEIIHPAHRAGPRATNTPEYLVILRELKLFQSTGGGSDYVWLEQLQSHRLFRWSFETIQQTVDVLLDAHEVSGLARDGLKASYARYQR